MTPLTAVPACPPPHLGPPAMAIQMAPAVAAAAPGCTTRGGGPRVRSNVAAPERPQQLRSSAAAICRRLPAPRAVRRGDRGKARVHGAHETRDAPQWRARVPAAVPIIAIIIAVIREEAVIHAARGHLNVASSPVP
jgi:hypothetical protein